MGFALEESSGAQSLLNFNINTHQCQKLELSQASAPKLKFADYVQDLCSPGILKILYVSELLELHLGVGSSCSALRRHSVLGRRGFSSSCPQRGGHGNHIRRGELPGVPVPAGVRCVLSSPVQPLQSISARSSARWCADTAFEHWSTRCACSRSKTHCVLVFLQTVTTEHLSLCLRSHMQPLWACCFCGVQQPQGELCQSPCSWI